MAVKLYVIIFILIDITSIIANSGEMKEKSPESELKTEKDRIVQKCETCRVFAESFKKGLERTANGKFEGGDADWEERKMGPYATSELRLVEILELVCTDVKTAADKCFQFASEYEELIEEYWSQFHEHDIFDYLCIGKLKVCCPEARGGEDCDGCPGYPDNVCGKRGKCDGEGTRAGSGECICDTGYVGRNCDECHPDYYDISENISTKVCIKCHESCANGCSDSGPKNCFDCKEGWKISAGECVDIDECQNNACAADEYCINKMGSFECFKCDQPCRTCFGPTIRGCLQCADGYAFRFGLCTEQDPYDTQEIIRRILMTILIFFGLVLGATFATEHWFAALVAFLIPIYTVASEFMTTSTRVLLEFYAQVLYDNITSIWEELRFQK